MARKEIEAWSYNQSVRELRPKVENLKTLTLNVCRDLYRARKELSKPGARTDLRPSGQRLQTWEGYLTAVGLAQRTAHRWLERYDPKKDLLISTSQVKELKAPKPAKKPEPKKPKPVNGERSREINREYRESIKPLKAAENREKQRKQDEEIERLAEQKANEKIVDMFDGSSPDQTKRREYKENIKLSQAGASNEFIDALLDYLEELDDENRRQEFCADGIKVLRNYSIYSQMTVEA